MAIPTASTAADSGVESGYRPTRCFTDQDGDFHLNGAKFYNDANLDISASLEELNSLAPAELAFLDGVTAGTAAASKAVVLDASKGITTITSATITTLTATTVNAVNVDAGSSGAAGTVDVFPATAAKGKLTISCADQTGDTAVTLKPAAMGQATQVNIPDPGAAASYLVQSTAALTLAEADVLDAVTPGTAAASKALVLSAGGAIATITSATITTLTAPTVNATNVDAGASGTAGTIDVFPTTASKGKFTLSCTDQTGDTAVTLKPAAMGQATQVNIADPGAAASYLMQSTAAITLAEADVLDAVTPGTAAASKAVVLGAGGDIATITSATITTGTIPTLNATNVDAGASGTAGSVDVFPTTAVKGKLTITAADSAGDTTTEIKNASQAGARVYTIPDAGASASFVMTGTAAQTIAGDLTVSGALTNAAYTQTATNIDAGASGTAGSVDVFPTTASKGKLAITCTDQTGDTTVGLVVGAMAAARTITLADPLAAADILTGKMAAVARTATVDGLTTGTIADAGLLQFVAVTAGGDANSIIILPTPTPGRIVILYVGATGYELRSSAPASVAINGGTGAAAESAIAANMLAVLICTSATTWHGFTITAATLAAVEAAA